MRGWRGSPLPVERAGRRPGMSRVVIIGATGHIGSYLVPRLVRRGHEVIAMSRGIRGPYLQSPEWGSVTTIPVDRDAADAEGTFGDQVAALRPEVVIDLICFTAASARQLVDALRPARPLLVHCGTIWVHGPALRVPLTEDEPRTAYGEYGTGKAQIEDLLHGETRAGGVPAIVLHPGHITGPGWPVITPAGNLDPDVWTRLATGRPPPPPGQRLGVRPRSCCTRATSPGRAGRSSARPATWIRTFGPGWPRAGRCRCPTTGWAC